MADGKLVAMAVTGAGLVVVGVLGVVFAVRVLSASPPPPPAARAPGNAAVGEDGLRAPGTEELRGLGCSPALVVDMARLLGDASSILPGEPRTMVTCDMPPGMDPPTCEHVAGVYFGAIGGTAGDAVGIRVLRGGSASVACSRLYAPNGADLGVFPRVP